MPSGELEPKAPGRARVLGQASKQKVPSQNGVWGPPLQNAACHHIYVYIYTMRPV